VETKKKTESKKKAKPVKHVPVKSAVNLRDLDRKNKGTQDVDAFDNDPETFVLTHESTPEPPKLQPPLRQNSKSSRHTRQSKLTMSVAALAAVATAVDVAALKQRLSVAEVAAASKQRGYGCAASKKRVVSAARVTAQVTAASKSASKPPTESKQQAAKHKATAWVTAASKLASKPAPKSKQEAAKHKAKPTTTRKAVQMSSEASNAVEGHLDVILILPPGTAGGTKQKIFMEIKNLFDNDSPSTPKTNCLSIVQAKVISGKEGRRLVQPSGKTFAILIQSKAAVLEGMLKCLQLSTQKKIA